MRNATRSLLACMFSALVLGSGLLCAPSTLELVPEIDDRHAQLIKNAKLPVLVFVYLKGDGPCDRQTPLVEALARKYRGKIHCFKVDYNQNPGLGVNTLPTLYLRTADGRVDTEVGLMSSAELEKWVDAALARMPAPQPAPSAKP